MGSCNNWLRVSIGKFLQALAYYNEVANTVLQGILEKILYELGTNLASCTSDAIEFI